MIYQQTENRKKVNMVFKLSDVHFSENKMKAGYNKINLLGSVCQKDGKKKRKR